MSGSTITNTGPITIDGDLGTGGTSITGFPPGTITGTFEIQLLQPLKDALAAYKQVAAQPSATTLTGDLGGMDLVPGVYAYPSSAALTGTLT